MAGELLFRAVNMSRVKRYSDGEVADWESLFLGPAPWGSSAFGPHFVVLEGPGFMDEAEWLWEEHGEFDVIPEPDSETATFLIPKEIAGLWCGRLEALEPKGFVRKRMTGQYEALLHLLASARDDVDVGVTVESLL